MFVLFTRQGVKLTTFDYYPTLLLPVLSLFLSFSLLDVLYDPTDLIWRKGISFEAMIGRTASSSHDFLP